MSKYQRKTKDLFIVRVNGEPLNRYNSLEGALIGIEARGWLTKYNTIEIWKSRGMTSKGNCVCRIGGEQK